MSDDSAKRAGSMSDTDRALAGRERRRSPAQGTPLAEPVHEVEPEDFTPITDVLALAETERERNLVKRIWRHSRNSELRQQRRVELTEGGTLRADLEDFRGTVIAALADIRGEHGNNGKLGEVRRRVDALSSRAWWLLTALIGGAGAAAVKLVIVTTAFNEVAARTTHNLDQIRLLQAQVQMLQAAQIARDITPAIEPGKDTDSP